MTTETWSDEQRNTYFDVRRSIRYHERRAAFFDTLHRITSVLTILLAGSVLFSVAHPGAKDPQWLVAIALVGSLLSAVDLVIGYAKHASLHSDLKRRFAELEIAILSKSEPADWVAHRMQRLSIEQDEPPIFRALDLLCHNELLVADGYVDDEYADHCCQLKWFEQLTCQLYRWPNIGTVQGVRRAEAKTKAKAKAGASGNTGHPTHP